ncbi:DUF4123 domain-containing protein [Actinobacillus vicugnae]|uniref:DUF4123 domain-containing protein n=1 Tax=Actinobacillus vicugnae TaxID=2573093 RepID=UPI0012416CFB|nr:DUF4123 domain-containing protein [Actinobacillus vicugnae]
MKELLSEEQQATVTQSLANMLKHYLAQKHFVYVVLEPNLDEEIKDLFFRSNIKYKEPFMLFDTRFEDVGPRIARLGDNQLFDEWVINQAFFNRWTALFVSPLDIQAFSLQISYLCNALTVDNKPVIFRCYTPTILTEWLPALREENQLEEAIGFCLEVVYLTDFPDKINHYYMDENDNFTQQEIDLQTQQPQLITRTQLPAINYSQQNWHISAKQHHSLIVARIKYLIHRIRARLLLNQSIRHHYSLFALHQILIKLANMCIQYQIMEDVLIETLINLHFGYTAQWNDNESEIIKLLSQSYSSEEKIERIATVLKNTKVN